jgi:prophage antirepressor-like protein
MNNDASVKGKMTWLYTIDYLTMDAKPMAVVPYVDITQIITYGTTNIQMFGTIEEPWFCGLDVASVLYKDPKSALQGMRDKHKTTLKELHEKVGGLFSPNPPSYHKGKMILINEAGLISLVLKSHNEIAYPFQDWATDAILALRKSGTCALSTRVQSMQAELNQQRLLVDDQSHKIAEANARACEEQFKRETEQKQREEAEAKVKEAEERVAAAEAEAKKAKDEKDQVTGHLNDRQPFHVPGQFYIGTSNADAKKKAFKPGHVDSVDPKAIKGRLSSYNTRGIDESEFYYVHHRQVLNAPHFDARVKAALSIFKTNPNKEMLVIDPADLLEIVEYLARRHDEDMEYINTFARERYARGIARPNALLPVLNTPERKPRSIADITDAERIQIATAALTEHMRDTTGIADWTYDTADMAAMRIEWMPLSNIIMRMIGLDAKQRVKLKGDIWINIYKAMADAKRFYFKQK